MTTLSDLYNTRPTYGTNMPTIQPTAPLYGTNMPSISPDQAPQAMNASTPVLDQAGYFAQNPNAGFGDYLNYAQGKTAGGQSQAPSSLPSGFLQSDYAPAYNSVLQSFNDPNYDKNSDPNGYAALLQNWTQAYAGGRPFSEWQQIAAQSAKGAIEPDIAQAALGGAAGVLYGAGVGAGAGSAAPGAAGGTGLIDAGTGLPAIDAGAAPISSGAMTDAAFGSGGATTAAGAAGTGLIDAGTSLPAVDAGAAGATGAAGGTAGGAGAGAAAVGSPLSRIIDGTATTADWTSVLGGAAGTTLGVAGSINQQRALQDLAKQQMAMGAPYRDRLASLYADPNSFLKSAEVTAPVQQGTDALARSLSVQGNPIGSGHALQELQNYSASQLFGKLGQEKDRLAGYGGLTAYNAAAPGTAVAGVNAGSNVWNAVGSGIANLTNPQPSLIDLYKTMKRLA